MTGVEAGLALCRFGQDAAALMLWGASAFLAVLVPRGLASAVAARLRRWAIAAVGLAVLATAARLPLDAAAIGSGWRDATDPVLLRAVAVGTSAGLSWQIQAVAAALLPPILNLPVRARLPALALASGSMLAALSLTGHAVMQDGALGLVHRANDALHVLAAGAWLGALAPVLVILPALDALSRVAWVVPRNSASLPSEGGQDGVGEPTPSCLATRRDAALALRRFSRAGHLAVALVFVSGVVNAVLTLRRWPMDLGSPYALLLALKIACVGAMVGLALVNRYVLVPRLARDAGAIPALRRGTIAEIPLGLAAIALVAVFGLLDPG